MEDFYINSTSQDQSSDYSNITFDYNVDNSTSYYDEKAKSIMFVVTCLIISVGLPLTLVAIYALYSMVRRDHVAPIYVINLLISDLLQLCYMIFEVANIKDGNVRKIFSFIYYSGLIASVGFMVCVALERYLVIVHPLWYRFRRTIKTSVAVCVLVWALPLVFFISIFLETYVESNQVFIIIILLPFPLLIFFLVGTFRALSASISVPSDEKRRIVGVLLLVLLIYTLLYLPTIIMILVDHTNDTLFYLSFMLIKLSPLADLVLYVFMRRGTIDKLLASVCCCRMDSNEISSSSI
ncbi:G-protein coupled receptor 4-like [Micropterus dolomieu]|uniref:G-protein coupled receptor 4-like n=1 Tax=Micropterus dolomieu TaxID=147949 RepID=UPI001E8E88AD|nr:G-protein coupled receptor 4-like [Micropterus dolomieu]